MQDILSLLACVFSRTSLTSFIVQFEDLLQRINSGLSENHIVTFKLFQSFHLKEHIRVLKRSWQFP